MLSRLLAFCLTMAVVMGAQASWVFAGSESKVKLAVVVSKSFPVDNLSFGDLKRLYMGDPMNSGGKRLIPLGLKSRTAERVAFDRAVLGMDPDAAAQYWTDRKIRGESGPPKAIESAEILLRVVEKLDGSLGYVRADLVNSTVKVLRIDGKSPADAGYRVAE